MMRMLRENRLTIVCGKTATVVVAKLNDDIISTLQQGCDDVEVSIAGVAASGGTADALVDNGYARDEAREVLAPS